MTKLRLLCVAGLLLAPPMLAAAHPIRAQKNPRNRFLGTASHKKLNYHHASHVKLVYCDWHVCKDEKPHYIGTASYYGKHYWQGRRMANGNRFDYRKLTAASWGIPLGTMVRVTNLSNGKSIVVEITDRGPAHNLHRVADLSQAAAEELDYVRAGLATVVIQPVQYFETETAVVEAELEESAATVAALESNTDTVQE